LLISINAKAETKCLDVIQACEETVQVSEYVIEALKKEKKIQADIIVNKQKRIDELSAWYKDPFVLIPLGIMIGFGIKK
jgi:sensor c-di-GMP phosphodiesterase-like protein